MTSSDGTDFLERMAASSRERVDAARARVPPEAMEQRANARGALPALQLSAAGFDVISEVKLRSPSEGVFSGSGIGSDEDRVCAQARQYGEAGAAAISVLTEPSEFHGSLSHLAAAASVTATPVMRKDFVVDPYQVLEGRASGASGVLLIARILDDVQIVHMSDLARTVGMFTLIECFDARDADRVTELWPSLSPTTPEPAKASTLVGVNCRDLTTLGVEFDRLEVLASRLPESAIKVAESGLRDVDHARRVAASGYSMALVGSALMRAQNPAELLRGMVHAGREEVACASA